MEPTLDEKATAYADAVIIAITETAKQLGEPDINAALVALAYTEGYLLAKLPVKERLAARKLLIDRVDADTLAFVNLGGAVQAGRG